MKSKLAAASVLLLMSGTLTAAAVYERETRVASDEMVWAAVISEILKKAPEGEVGPRLRILSVPTDYPPMPGTVTRRAAGLSAWSKGEIARLVVTGDPVEWVGEFRGCENPRPTNRFVAVGQIVDKGDHREVMTYDARGCLYATWATYRVDRQGKVTGLAHAPTGMMPAVRTTSPGAGS